MLRTDSTEADIAQRDASVSTNQEPTSNRRSRTNLLVLLKKIPKLWSQGRAAVDASICDFIFTPRHRHDILVLQAYI